MGIQRWTETACVQKGAEFSQEMRPFDKGMYVLFTDHEQVVAELDGVIEQRDALDVACLDMEREITRLRAELAAKSKDAERWQKWMPWMRRLNRKPFNLTKEIADIDSAMGEGNGR